MHPELGMAVDNIACRRLVRRLAYNGDFVAFKMGRRQGKRVGGSAYWRIGVSGDAFSQGVAR